MAELFLLALASALWPALIAVVLVALRSDRPGRILLGFLIGGLATTITIGVAVVWSIKDSSFVTGSRPPADPIFDLTVGILLVSAGLVVSRRPPKPKPEATGPDRWTRLLARGAPLAFLVGVVLNIVPGVVPIVALKDIAQLDYSLAGTIAVVTAFYVVMFALVEVPLIALVIAPTRAAAGVERMDSWLDRNGQRVVVLGTEAIGAYLIVRGIFALLR